MPCYTVTTVQIDAGKMDMDTVVSALREMGLSPRRAGQTVFHNAGQYDRETGIATWRGQDRTAELKVAYSREGLKAQARKMGWTLKQDAANPSRFELLKR